MPRYLSLQILDYYNRSKREINFNNLIKTLT